MSRIRPEWCFFPPIVSPWPVARRSMANHHLQPRTRLLSPVICRFGVLYYSQYLTFSAEVTDSNDIDSVEVEIGRKPHTVERDPLLRRFDTATLQLYSRRQAQEEAYKYYCEYLNDVFANLFASNGLELVEMSPHQISRGVENLSIVVTDFRNNRQRFRNNRQRMRQTFLHPSFSNIWNVPFMP